MAWLRVCSVLAALAFPLVSACDKESEAAPAQAVVASAVVTPKPPEGPKVIKLTIDPASKTAIDMPAQNEHIKAETTAAAGTLTIDPTDLTKTRGIVRVDLTTLRTTTFGNAEKDGLQTEHAHNWLEAGKLVTPEVKETNRWAIFTIKEVAGVGEADLSKVTASGDTRTVDAIVKGDFFLHGHQAPKEAPVEVVFHYPAGQAMTALPDRVDVRTKSPLQVTLKEHDVKPRDNFGKLAQATLQLVSKVAETADVTLDIHATPSM